MDFPDLLHLLQLQKDLWQWPSSRAAVMVGAGFSLNSTPSPGVNTRFPTWRQLSRSMFDEIYPRLSNETEEEREERFARSNALRLASEYEAAFDRRKLGSLIRAKIPDSDHQPGDMHSLLLQLPWKDVFTTNYDTLLERTEVPGRAYQPVMTVNDLTSAFSPRIIKLHGSFPSQTPFIITEEDYRTYPKCFAPFVNTVRQSLIENAFVLIGFSGDDPNFLEWMGWIRDELDDHHAPIYLVGALSLDNMQRPLLAQRGVTPIDLTPVFLDKNLPGGIHTASLEWFLRSLLAVRPQRPGRWPEIAPRVTIDFEPPILTSGRAEPEEVDLPSSSRGALDEATVKKVIKRWHFERNRYPGWLVPTDGVRSSLRHKTEYWIKPLIKSAENWSTADQILLFREINWRLEASMIPLFPEWITPFESTADKLFPTLKDGTHAKPPVKVMINITDTEVSEAWLEIAFALLREAREMYDSKRWNTFKEKIGQIVDRYPKFTDRYHYEQALWMVWNIERSKAKEVLVKWQPSLNSPLAMMWKAGLLTELDELSEARSLLRTALRALRKSLHNTQGQNISLLSLEGWCMYLLFSVETAIAYSKWSELSEEFSERWQELKAWDCDPNPLILYFNRVLSETPPVRKRGKQVVRGFDPWRQSVSYSLGGSDTQRLPAFAFIRLYEQAGIPMRFNISGDMLRNACKWVDPFIGFWSPAILIRAGRAAELRKHGFIDRTQVAAMTTDVAKSLNKWAMEALKRELLPVSGKVVMGSAQESLLEVLAEFLSRLTVKLEATELQESFSLALELHRQPIIFSHNRLHKLCEPWFERLLEAVEDQQLLSWTPELIRFPLYNESEQVENLLPNTWPDPITSFPVDRVRYAQKSNSELLFDIEEATGWLLERARSETGEGRRRALLRLIYVFHADLMTEEQQGSFTAVLWKNTGASGLPDLPNFLYSNYLQLPAPKGVDVASKVKETILNLTPIRIFSQNAEGNSIAGTSGEDRAIREWSFSSKPTVEIPHEPKGTIEWNLEEIKKLWGKVLEWWENDKIVLAFEKSAPFLGSDPLSATLKSLEMFLARTVLPGMDSASEDEWNKLLSFLSETRQNKVYMTRTLPYVLLHRSIEKDAVTQTILDDLSSVDEEAVIASARAVRHWLHLAGVDGADSPPTTVVDELIRRIIFRRPEGIRTCLEQLAFLLIEKSDSFNPDQVNLIVSSLTPWSHATHLPLSEEKNVDFPEEDRPELRALLGILASALSIWLKKKFADQPEPSEISLLRESYKLDTLPEVRRSFDTWKYFYPDLSV